MQFFKTISQNILKILWCTNILYKLFIKMEKSRTWKLLLRAALRYILITISTGYCNLTYLMWTALLQPLKWTPHTEKWYWKAEGLLYQNNLSFFAFWTYNAGYHILELGDDVSDLFDKPSLVIVNHQSMADVPMVISAFNSKHNLSNNIMWIIYVGFKYTNFGIIAGKHQDFFIDVGKGKRDSCLAELATHLKDVYLPLKRRWLTIFPEGDFMLRCHSSNQEYAKKHGYPVLENCLLPRVAAIKTVLDNAAAGSHTDPGDRLKYVIDVTIAYPDINNPLTLNTIFNGMKPSFETVFHYRKYNIEEVPRDSDGLTSWLYERYQEKDQMLAEYYRTGVFPDHPNHIKDDLNTHTKDDLNTHLRNGVSPQHPTSHPDQTKDVNSTRRRGKRIIECKWQFLVNHCFCIMSMCLGYWIIYSAYRYLVSLLSF